MSKILSAVWDKLGAAIAWVINLLPSSPFTAITNSGISDFIGSFNWIFPITEILAIMQLWITAITAFYLYQAILRWVKAIE